MVSRPRRHRTVNDKDARARASRVGGNSFHARTETRSTLVYIPTRCATFEITSPLHPSIDCHSANDLSPFNSRRERVFLVAISYKRRLPAYIGNCIATREAFPDA